MPPSMFFTIIINKKSYPNGCFDLAINWKPEDFIGSSQIGCGYIVQKITRDLVATDEFIHKVNDSINDYRHVYYEAWKVDNGEIVLDADYGYHDKWTYTLFGYFGMLNDFKMKYGTCGCLNVTGEVFWINAEMREYQSIPQVFKKKAIKYACELPSTRIFNEAAQLHPVCIRQITGSWNFTNDDQFIEALLSYSKMNQPCKEKWLNNLKDIFMDMPIWNKIVESINKC